jgi:hypothetical protein
VNEPPEADGAQDRAAAAVGDAERQKVVDRLCEAFAEDRLAVEEFERRVDVAHRAATARELARLLADLPTASPPVRRSESGGAVPASDHGPATLPATVSGERRPTQPPESVRSTSFIAGVMGGATRKGNWRPARVNYAIGVMGGFDLDFRDAIFPPGVTEVRVFAFWGGGDIVVPPDVALEVSAVGLMGGFEEGYDAPSSPGPDAPVLRVTGLAIMGGADVRVRYPGESKGDAKRRIRAERKARKRLARGGGDDG